MRILHLALAIPLCLPSALLADAGPAELAAGYKALFTCSATFLAGRSQAQIEHNELTGIYRDYRRWMNDLPAAQIDQRGQSVSVAPETGRAAVARFREPLGCTLLPADAAAGMKVPEISLPAHRAIAAAWPDGEETEGPITAADAKGTPIARTVARAFDGHSYGRGSRTSAVVIAGDDGIIAEAYSADSGVDVPQRTWSVAKTIMAALIGIASAEGLLKPEDPAGLPQWNAPGDERAGIRISHLLHMASGLDAGLHGNRTDQVYFGGARIVDASLGGALLASPGSRWNYANNDTLALSYILRRRIADDGAYLAYPHVKLFRRIGMLHTTPETDWDGTYILSSQVWTTARDLARFGLLLMNDGAWNGERILPAGWVRYMTAAAPAQPRPDPDGTRGPGYGAQVWLFGKEQGLPEGTYAAMGNRGQYVFVVPARRLVIVRRGFDPEDGRFLPDKFSADVLAAWQQ